MISIHRFLACALSTALAWSAIPGVARAQTSDVERTTLVVRQALERYARETQAPAAGQAQPASAAPAAATVPLTMDEAVRLALENNLEIAVQRLDPQTFDFSLASIRAVYRPTLNSTFGPQSRVSPPTSTLNGGTGGVETATKNYNTGISQGLPWGGGSYTFSWNNSKQTSSNVLSNYNPQFGSTFAASYTQPLLMGFRIDNTRQQLLVTRINQQISEEQLRAVVTNTLANVRNAYWDYVYTVQVVESARQYLALAEQLLGDNKIRVEVGTLAPLDVLQSESEVATRRQVLTQAQANQRTAELVLKRLIVSGTEDRLWRPTINPIDRPTVESAPIDVEAAIRLGLENRTDVLQAKRTLESNDVTLRYLRDQTLPALNLTASYGAQGVGGTQFLRSGSGPSAIVVGTVPGGYTDALRTMSQRRLSQLEPVVHLQLPARHEQRGGADRAGADPGRRLGGTDPRDGAPGRHRHHQRGAAGGERAPPRGRRRRGPHAGAAPARGRTEQARRRDVHDVPGHAGPAGPRRIPGHATRGDARLPQGARRLRSAPADDVDPHDNRHDIGGLGQRRMRGASDARRRARAFRAVASPLWRQVETYAKNRSDHRGVGRLRGRRGLLLRRQQRDDVQRAGGRPRHAAAAA